MGVSFVVSGLVTKRAELAGLIDHHQQEVERLAIDLIHLDATLKLFSPQIDLGTIKRKKYRRYSRIFKQGECHRMSINALRRAPNPISTATIAEVIMKSKEIPADQYETVCDSVNNSLRYAEGTGMVRRNGMEGASIVWELV